MKNFSKLILLAMVLILWSTIIGCNKNPEDTNQANSLIDGWEKIGFSGGGLITAILFNPTDTNTIYVGTELSGVFKTIDGGITWLPASQGLSCLHIVSLSTSQVDSNTIFTSTSQGLYKSENSAESWNICNENIDNFALVSPEAITISNDGKTIIAVHHYQENGFYEGDIENAILSSTLYRSTDAGNSWNEIPDMSFFPAGTRIPAVAFDPYQNSRVYALVSNYGVYVSKDSGKSWNEFSEGFDIDVSWLKWKSIAIGSNYLYVSAYDEESPIRPARLYKSPKNNSAWQSILGNLPEDETPGFISNKIVVSPENDDLLYLSYNTPTSSFYISYDGGNSWNNIVAVQDENYFPDIENSPYESWMGIKTDITTLAIDPLHENRLFAGTRYGVWLTEDGGYTWHETVKGIFNTQTSDFIVSNDSILTANKELLLMKSEDDGNSWQASFSNFGNEFLDDTLQSLAIETSSDGTIYSAFTTSDEFKVYRSSDQGLSWTKTSSGLPTDIQINQKSYFAPSLTSDSNNPERIYFVNPAFFDITDDNPTGGIYFSSDKGENWNRLSNQPGTGSTSEDYLITCISVAPNDSNLIIAGTYKNGLWYSNNSASTWSQSGSTENNFNNKSVEQIVIQNDGTIIAALDDGVYTSSDNGINFKRSFPTIDNLGDDYDEILTTIAYNSENPSELVTASSATSFPYNSTGSLWYSDDKGINWTNITNEFPYHQIKKVLFRNGYLYIATKGTNIWRKEVSKLSD